MTSQSSQRSAANRHLAITAPMTCGVLAASLLAASFVAPAAFAAPTPETTLLAHYSFDDPTVDGVIEDQSSNNADATLINPSSASTVDGASGSKALALPGGASNSAGAYVDLPKDVLTGAKDLTVSTRVRWTESATSWQWLFALGSDTTRYLFSTPRNGDGTLRTALTTSGGGGESQVTGSAPLPGNEWKTLTVTLDTAQQRLTTYLDGVAVDSAPTTVTASELLTATSTRGGFIGKSFYQDPLFAGAIDDFRIYSSALTPEQVADLVEVDLPTVTELRRSTVDVRTSTGTAPALPATMTGAFTDGYDRQVPVRWDAVDPGQYAERGSFTASGTAAGRTVTAQVTVTLPGELSIDLGSDTGAFHGGASGTLYGLYGDGLPSDNLIEGINLRTVSTKAQDGPQHPGADALEVVKPLADASDGDVYIYMTDIHRGFPYEWPGSTPEEKLTGFKEKIATQVDQVLSLPPEYQDNIVFVPFNEPEGNMFGTGQWSYDGVSWLDNPTDYFAAWDEVHALIREKMPTARIAGPNTSILFDQVKGFLEHARDAGTVPDVITWHELSNPAEIRSSVQKYRAWEDEVFAGTEYEGKDLPININEYAHNYHTSVPGQMIQWVSAIEESKVDADIAYWNIDGNLSDSAVQSNRGNGQWWLLNAYTQMSGHTVSVEPPAPDESYTLQGVATLDEDKAQARAIFGGSAGEANVQFENVDPELFGSTVHASVREITWTGQIGDSAGPEVLRELQVPVVDGAIALNFGADLPGLKESSAYEVILTPGEESSTTAEQPTLWKQSIEAEDAAHTGAGWSRNGPEGSPADVGKFYTSGGYNVGGLRSGSDVKLDFPVTVPQDGTYDLSVFANSLNTFDAVQEQGPTNVFVTVDGKAEQELFLPLGYKWVVWDHSDTTVDLTAGEHIISLSAKSVDGSRSTKGDAIVDKIDLSLANPAAQQRSYEAEYAELDGGQLDYTVAGASASGVASLGADQSATFWVYSASEGESTVHIDSLNGGKGHLSVNGTEITDITDPAAIPVFLRGGINKVVVEGTADTLQLDRLRLEDTEGTLVPEVRQGEQGILGGTAAVTELSLASDGKVVTGVGGEPGNANTLTFDDITVDRAGRYALTVRYSNEEQSPPSHYNPDPIARPADISVNGEAPERVLFPHTFHENNFWEMTIDVELKAGTNSIRFSSEEQPNFDGETYISNTWAGIPLRSSYAPNIDRISITALTTAPVVTPVDQAPTFIPAPVANKHLSKKDMASFGLGRTKYPRGASQIELKNLAPDAWFHTYLNQTSLGWKKASADGFITVNTPTNTKPGNNRIVVHATDGQLVGWEKIRITGPIK